MTQETAVGGSDLEQLQRRVDEYRSVRPSRGRLPAAVWEDGAEAARRYGLNPVAQILRLDYNRLKKRMGAPAGRDVSKQTTQKKPTPELLELIQTATNAMQDCRIEVE